MVSFSLAFEFKPESSIPFELISATAASRIAFQWLCEQTPARCPCFARGAEFLLLQFLKKRWPAWSEIRQKKISGAAVGFHAKLFQFCREPRAQPFHSSHVSLHGGAVVQRCFRRHQGGEIDREGRHGAAYESERIFAGDHRAEAQGGEPRNFRKRFRDEQLRILANPRHRGEP